MPQRQTAVVFTGGAAHGFGPRHRWWQGLQQRFAIIDGFGVVAGARRLVPLRPTVAAVALPITAVAIGIIVGAFVAGTLFTGAILTGPIFGWARGAWPILPVILRTLDALPIAARTVIALPVFPGPVFPGPILTLPVFTRAVVALPLLRALIAHPFRRAIIVAFFIAAGVIAARTAIIHIVAAIVDGVTVTIAVQAIIIITVAAAARVRLAITIIAKQPEIMFGILQIIFGGHAITGLLRITRQRPIFFQQLGGVAALAIVEPRAIIVATSHLLRAWAIVAATPTPALVVSDQDRDPRSWPGRGPTWARCG
jgi:hypothetical protein